MKFDFAIAPVDAAVLIIYLIGVVLFRMWIGRGQHNVTGYLLGGRDVPWWALLGSIVATETSTATFLSVPGLAFAEPIPGARRWIHARAAICVFCNWPSACWSAVA